MAFNAKLYCCCSPEGKLIPGALLSTEKQISGLCGYFNCSFIYFYTYNSPEAEVVTVCLEIHPSGIKDTCQSLVTRELI